MILQNWNTWMLADIVESGMCGRSNVHAVYLFGFLFVSVGFRWLPLAKIAGRRGVAARLFCFWIGKENWMQFHSGAEFKNQQWIRRTKTYTWTRTARQAGMECAHNGCSEGARQNERNRKEVNLSFRVGEWIVRQKQLRGYFDACPPA